MSVSFAFNENRQEINFKYHRKKTAQIILCGENSTVFIPVLLFVESDLIFIILMKCFLNTTSDIGDNGASRTWKALFRRMLTFGEGLVFKMTSIAYSFMNNKGSAYNNDSENSRRCTEVFAKNRSISVNDVTTRCGTYPKSTRKRSRSRRNQALTVSFYLLFLLTVFEYILDRTKNFEFLFFSIKVLYLQA